MALRNRIRDIAITFLLGAHGAAFLIRAPSTLRQLWTVLRSEPGPNGREIAAFGPRDFRFRPWYAKIARDYRQRGRLGFAWDDGLGMPLGPRIYNNWATYTVLEWFGTRRMAALGHLLIVAATATVAAAAFGWSWGLAAGGAAGVSPLLVLSYTHMGKPEVFWWWVVPIAVALGFSGHVVAAGLLWSLIAFMNLPIAVLSALIVGPSLVVAAIPGSIGGLLLGVLPGVLKTSIRLLSMIRTRFLGALVSEQRGLWKRGPLPTVRELVWQVPFVVSVGASAWHAGLPLAGLTLGILGAGLLWANYRLIFLNDRQSFHMGFWTVALGFACGTGSAAGALAAFLMAFNSPKHCGAPSPTGAPSGLDGWAMRRWRAATMFRDFPGLRRIPVLRPAPVMEFFDQIPVGARVIAEGDGHMRDESAFRGFWVWTEEFLPARDVDQINEMYTRIVEPDLAERYLGRFAAGDTDPAETMRVMKALGASHVVASSTDSVAALEGHGFTRVAEVDLVPLIDFRELTGAPPVLLVLLRSEDPGTVISPSPANYRVERSSIRWNARAGTEYVIRYRHYDQFEARQNGLELPVHPTRPFDDAPTRFMRICAVADAELVLEYRGAWTG